ncbi:centrosomal protein 43-like [Pollicipes pollicipes]|uniref:centrosomal protein 43-like n=1 Tax=Pollicipes pollicipes TaxID=41117 RepID=UPI001884A125|nr:centrosomal protein 43-like [Pollicipes pollicipes]
MSSSLMAEDECEVELRDMVAEALENNGVLPKIRAQLRASVFLALDETGRPGGDQARCFENTALQRLAAGAVGRRCLALARELLVCAQLDCTLSVLDAELEGVAGWREERPRLAAALGLQPADDQPVLAALLADRPGDAEDSISEEIDPAADSLASEPQSDGLTEDVSITSMADIRADVIEGM